MISVQAQNTINIGRRLVAQTERLIATAKPRITNMATPAALRTPSEFGRAAEMGYVNALKPKPDTLNIVKEYLAAEQSPPSSRGVYRFASQNLYKAAKQQATDYAIAEWSEGKVKGNWQTRDAFVKHRVNELMKNN